MRDQHLSTPGRALRVALAILAAGAGLAMIYSCSLIVARHAVAAVPDHRRLRPARPRRDL